MLLTGYSPHFSYENLLTAQFISTLVAHFLHRGSSVGHGIPIVAASAGLAPARAGLSAASAATPVGQPIVAVRLLSDHGRDDPHYELRPGTRDFNHSYPRGYRVSDCERARREAKHHPARRGDRRPDNRFDRSHHYDFDRAHRATPDERRRGEKGHHYGFDPGPRVTP